MVERLTIVGVRHHSPACARLVQQTLARLRPRFVLIEGPDDFNGRLGELTLDHEPPIALFTHHFREDQRYASWAPFCVHSPEWVGLREGLAAGAEVRFIDLPGWTDALRGLENRYADGPARADPSAALAEATGEIGYDAVWDALFELPEPDGLAERLTVYFDGLREHVPAAPSDLRREEHMGAWIRWALGQGGEVLVICGGFHAPALRALAAGPAEASPPEVPAPPADARCETWLIPFTQRRLDSFAGYASGLPSPAWYRWVWDEGADEAPRRALRATAERLRERNQVVSVADTIAAWTQALALARLRGRTSVGRVDLLDAVASTWVKEALDQPLPWSERRTLSAATHPVLVELVAALSGDRRGTLHPDTPLPPLAHHVARVREELDLQAPAVGSREVVLSTSQPDHDPRRFALERMLLLGIAGIVRASRPDALEQRYVLGRHPDAEVSVLEASAYGPTLESAATARLEERAGEAQSFPTLVAVLTAALRAGLSRLSQRALDALEDAARAERELGPLGTGLSGLVGILRHGALTPSQRHLLTAVADAAVDRGLWLVEGQTGDAPLDLGRIGAVVGLRDASAQVALTIPVDRVAGVFTRVSGRADAPADLRGACLGGLASLGTETLERTAELALTAVDGLPPTRLGDYLAGLLTVAREVLSTDAGLVEGIDGAVGALDPVEFGVALPSLRQAFGVLPPRERADLARVVAALHGAPGANLQRRLTASPVDLHHAATLQVHARELLANHGIRV